ncbi:sodium/glucose cotransporter 4-like [Gigantopelta aegis]|uniref:sodium/glucose cotransporter 4-like n=1 Tax=Gigantopelta aegis TaxID=1735272 RepID=UPI001B88D543|nr:sodium/glucose cotransporter 4-like [Gigantopelta aegis]
MVETLEAGDYVMIAIYFILVLAVGLWSTFRPNRNSATGYFLAGKNMHWIPVGASIFASNVGAPMFIGLAGQAAASGFAAAVYEWHAVYLLIALGWIFVPVYVASGTMTMPEYLKKRFGGKRLRIYLSILALLKYMLTNISGEIFSGAIFLQQLLGWNLYLCVVIILGITAIYTVAGGLAAVIYTDTLQTVILLVGSFILMIISFVDVGGWEQMMRKYAVSAANYTLADPQNYSCGLPREDYMHIFRDPIKGDIPWPGAVFGATTLGILVWCADQIMVQRCLAAKNMSHAKGGAALAAFLKILPFFLFMIPGMISRVLFPNDIACADPDKCEAACGNRAGCTNIAYPLLVLRKMPAGLKGLMLAALLAALMSSLTSIFNSASSMFTMDLWRRFRRHAKQSELMLVGRVCVLVLVAVSILWIPILQQAQSGQLWSYVQAVASYTSPPWCWVFLLALFWKRTTEAGAFWGLMISLVVGFAWMAMDMTFPAPPCGSTEPDTRPAILAKIHFLHFALILSGVTIISTVVISLITTPRPPEKLNRVTWWTRHSEKDLEESDSEDDFAQGDDDDNDNDEPIKSVKRKKLSPGRKVYNWLCGVDNKPKPKITPEEKELIRKKMTSLAETPKARRYANICAVIAVTVTTFLLGFFH